MKADQIALQLYTVRDAASEDMVGTLRKVAAMGYKNVELAGYGNSNPDEIAATLAELGLKAVAAHVGLQLFQAPDSTVFEDLKKLGITYAIIPWLAPEMRGADQAPALAETLNTLGQQARDNGMVLAYHNHDFEFAKSGDTDFYTILTENTDPELVKLELDVYWVAYAGLDPVEVINHFGNRVVLVHAKDMSAAEDRSFGIVGEGVLNWPEIIAAADRAGAAYYVVEHDRPTDALADVERGIRNLEQMAS